MKQILTVLLVLLALPIIALAQSDNYEITHWGACGVDAGIDSAIYVERGGECRVEVWLEGTGETTDVQVKTWLGGYEYDDVSVTSDMFDVEDGVTYKKTLKLELPSDLEADKEYTLYVQVFDSDNSETISTSLMVSRIRHSVEILDVLLSDTSLESGDSLYVTARVKNYGDKKEEDIKVEASIEDLGISASTYVDELAAYEEDNEDEEDSSSSQTLYLKIPEDAASGAYDLDITVTYNNGYDTVTQTESISVSKAASTSATTTTPAVTVTTVVPSTTTAATSTASTSVSTKALKIGFGVLAAILIILALILIFKR
ncbi:hypothetical protein HZB88_05240 [archaeon]|nr:hypothetical protein [archaeon]